MGNLRKKILFTGLFTLLLCLVPSCDQQQTKTTVQKRVPLTVTDIDGNVYQTIKIGNQIWTTENLRTTRYRDGGQLYTYKPIFSASCLPLQTIAETAVGWIPRQSATAFAVAPYFLVAV